MKFTFQGFPNFFGVPDSWDAFAIYQKHWTFDPDQILGFYGPLDIPLEEFAFFVIIPIAAILTLEGVKVVLNRLKR